MGGAVKLTVSLVAVFVAMTTVLLWYYLYFSVLSINLLVVKIEIFIKVEPILYIMDQLSQLVDKIQESAGYEVFQHAMGRGDLNDFGDEHREVWLIDKNFTKINIFLNNYRIQLSLLA